MMPPDCFGAAGSPPGESTAASLPFMTQGEVSPQDGPTQNRAVWRGLSPTGLVVASVGFAAALTPSMLPRPLIFLILLAVLGTVVGYGIGASAGWLGRKTRWQPGVPRWVPIILPVAAWLPSLAFAPIAIGWQAEQQSALAMPAALPSTLLLLVLTAILATLFLLLGRCLRLATNAMADAILRTRPLARRLKGKDEQHQRTAVRFARLGTAVVAILLAFGLLQGGFALLVQSYDQVNADTSGQSEANLGLNSGSSQSRVPWSTLGREGRYFVGNTLPAAEISEITERPAAIPLRLYVGMQQADTPQARTDLALAELDRSGAWDRDYLAIIAVTGTGWVDPDAINSLEIVTNGEIASIAVQYTAVPSWIGFVIDPDSTQAQNANTIQAVLSAWRARPADRRPTLILFGESLGAFGSQAAWPVGSTPEEVTREIRHIVWIGPPSGSRLWKQWQADRTAGPAWQPIIGDGKTARVFINDVELTLARPLTGPAITFSAHPNDPVVYWSPDLLFSKPEWMNPLGPGVDPHLRYFPIITFLALGLDLISGGGPPEVGHNYSGDIGPAVALTVAPSWWTPAMTQELQQALPGLHYQTG